MISYKENYKQAKEKGLKTYSGKPCIYGHISDRLVCNRVCIICAQERTRVWRKKNFDHIKKYSLNYHRSKPHIKRISEAHRNALKRSSEGKFTYDEIQIIYNKQNGLCAVCKCSLIDSGYHIDHKIPLSRGGSNWSNNLQLLCPHDNVSKNALTDLEYLERLQMAA